MYVHEYYNCACCSMNFLSVAASLTWVNLVQFNNRLHVEHNGLNERWCLHVGGGGDGLGRGLLQITAE